MSALHHDPLTLAQAARIMREALRDKTYQLYPMGQEAAAYLRVKRKRLTDSSYRDYERGLDKLARYFPDLELAAFEPPVGTDRLEEFLDAQYGDGSPRNYNKNLSILRDFFKFQVVRGRLHGDPTTPIERARARQVYRTTFTTDQRRAIIASADTLRDRIALRLLLDYGLRKGALKAVQFKHFDHQRKRLTIFTKGRKVRDLPLPHPAFWHDLERHLLDVEARPSHYLMCRTKTVPRAGVVRFPDKPLGDHGLHDWWYKRLADAGIVPAGTTSGERMHKARHCLALDTPVFTFRGWSTMGALTVGDCVYAQDGTATRVVGTSAVFHRDCYELKFGDGTTIVATDDHRWPVWDSWDRSYVPRGAWKILTTAEIAQRWCDKRSHNRFRVSCGAVVAPPHCASLPIDPYIFGYWLGDGYSHHADIVVGEQDREHLTTAIRQARYAVLNQTPRRSEWGTGWRIRFANGEPRGDGIESRLRAMGVLGSGLKRIPPVYMTASADQRSELLAGLLDSDGSMTECIVQFRSTLDGLAQDVFELTRSLGLRSRLSRQVLPKGKPQWNVRWTPPSNPFHNPRKAAKFVPVDRTGKRAKRIDLMSITGVRRVPTVPTRCIEVEHPSHVFLAGRTFVPTCNSAGQRVLDQTGNLKAVQKLLGHASIQTTGDVYADWDIESLTRTMADVLKEDDDD